MDNLEKYNKSFEEAFGISLSNIVFKLEKQSISEWDSLGHMVLITAIEETFDITLNPEDIIEFTSYEKGKEILSRYKIDMK